MNHHNHRESRIENPVSSIVNPESRIQNPVSRIQYRVSSIELPPLHLSRNLYKSATFYAKQTQFPKGQNERKLTNNNEL